MHSGVMGRQVDCIVCIDGNDFVKFAAVPMPGPLVADFADDDFDVVGGAWHSDPSVGDFTPPAHVDMPGNAYLCPRASSPLWRRHQNRGCTFRTWTKLSDSAILVAIFASACRACYGLGFSGRKKRHCSGDGSPDLLHAKR